VGQLVAYQRLRCIQLGSDWPTARKIPASVSGNRKPR
jgi:hypothetical protein